MQKREYKCVLEEKIQMREERKRLYEESKKESILLKKMTKYWNFQIENAQKEVNLLLDEINFLQKRRFS